jgi:succinate-acetate transporter protein
VSSVLLWVASLRTNVVLCALFTLLIPTFFVLAIGHAGAHAGLTKIGGWLGLIVAA